MDAELLNEVMDACRNALAGDDDLMTDEQTEEWHKSGPTPETVLALAYEARDLATERTAHAATRKDYEDACALVARMHAAAVGEIRGPSVGPVEDVAALKAERDEAVRMLREGEWAHRHDDKFAIDYWPRVAWLVRRSPTPPPCHGNGDSCPDQFAPLISARRECGAAEQDCPRERHGKVGATTDARLTYDGAHLLDHGNPDPIEAAACKDGKADANTCYTCIADSCADGYEAGDPQGKSLSATTDAKGEVAAPADYCPNCGNPRVLSVTVRGIGYCSECGPRLARILAAAPTPATPGEDRRPCRGSYHRASRNLVCPGCAHSESDDSPHCPLDMGRDVPGIVKLASEVKPCSE